MNTGGPLERPGEMPHTGTAGMNPISTTESAKDQIKEQTRETADKVTAQAKKTVEQVKEQSQNMIRQQKEQLLRKLHNCSSASRSAAEQLRNDNDESLAQYAEAIADQIDRGSDYIRDRNGRDIIDDLGGLARRQPEIFFGGMFIAGLCLARFLKASSKRPHEEEYSAETEFAESGWSEPTYGLSGPGMIEDEPVVVATSVGPVQPAGQ